MLEATEKKRILIVEDDLSMQMFYNTAFEGFSDKYNVEIASNSMAAFRRLREDKFDLVILDIIMEAIQGDSLFACMKKTSKNENTPVVVISVLDQDDSAVKFILDRENTEYLQKPITKEQLFSKIQESVK